MRGIEVHRRSSLCWKDLMPHGDESGVTFESHTLHNVPFLEEGQSRKEQLILAQHHGCIGSYTLSVGVCFLFVILLANFRNKMVHASSPYLRFCVISFLLGA